MSATAPKRTYGKLTIVSRGLYLGSLPLEAECPSEPEAAAEQRRVHCRRYVNCMTYAAAQNWRGFHCGECDIDETISRDDWLSDLDGLAKFLRALGIGR